MWLLDNSVVVVYWTKSKEPQFFLSSVAKATLFYMAGVALCGGRPPF